MKDRSGAGALDIVRYWASAGDLIFKVIWFAQFIYKKDTVNIRSDSV
jgi:hypothetical protein